ncbi:HlyD family efflux transporter periplasmic adaptor subunit [Intestinibacter sp.]|uniref:HlyD family efflux transporter periplasmic adaptor subunit n=1 Tax=Intestinibacter sp. TaxID=1965304 RepID=UPI002A75D570|nr:HlyD family efflux transporter periplasmic adaptor subunit [Intestinibacter sp.]MDY2737953.1 HlyD family efflux transporter periplasmic adaptor subunit [Intestinibacter sp.]MDY4573897.1 HlyD family efflux transporter periplasmic adaptor subunit [Intestinibacter sp.]
MAKKRIKIKYTNLFILIVIVYISVQIIIWAIGYFTKTKVLENECISLKIKETGLVVMEEYLIKSNEEGTVSYNVCSGEKIQKDKSILTVNQLNQNDEISSQIKSLQDDIKKLEQEKNSVNSNIILNKKEQLKILESKRNNYFIDYKSPISGIVSFKYDDNYDKLDRQKEDIDEDIIDSIENNFVDIKSEKHKVKSSDILLRIINPNEVYVYIFTDKNVLKNNQDVNIVINEQEISGKVYNIYKKNGKNAAIIKIMEQNMSIYDTRIKEFDIIYKKIEGFKIPIESIVEENNILGVYVINEETKMPEFVSLNKNFYKDEKYLYVDYNRIKDEKNLNLYDRILLYPNFINKNIKVSR